MMTTMTKKTKPGDMFNKFQKKKKSYSESDMGSMKGYDPNGGLGKAGYRAATSVPKARTSVPFKRPTTNSVPAGAPKFNAGGAQGGRIQNPNRGPGNANATTKMFAKKKHSKSMPTKHCKSCSC